MGGYRRAKGLQKPLQSPQKPLGAIEARLGLKGTTEALQSPQEPPRGL